DVNVDFTTSDITAKAGTNYLAVSNHIFFPVGETFRTVVVPVLDDNVVGPDTTALLSLSNPTGEAAVTNQPTAVLTIYNDDCKVGFSSTNFFGNEGNVSAVITLTRTGSLRSPCSAGYVTLTNGTATPTNDFVPVSGAVTFAAGETNASFI